MFTISVAREDGVAAGKSATVEALDAILEISYLIREGNFTLQREPKWIVKYNSLLGMFSTEEKAANFAWKHYRRHGTPIGIYKRETSVDPPPGYSITPLVEDAEV